MPPGQHRPEQREEERGEGRVEAEPLGITEHRTEQRSAERAKDPDGVQRRAHDQQGPPVRSTGFAGRDRERVTLIDDDLSEQRPPQPATR